MHDRHRREPAAIALAVAMLVAACTGSGMPTTDPPREPGSPAATATPTGTEPPMSAAPTAPDPGAEPTASPTDPPIDAPPILDQAWATAELTDVATGETFRIADLAGRVVVLETIAIWCSNCRAQQADVYRALEALGEADVAYVLLGVDPNETAAALATYRDRNGFTGTYAIAGRDVSRALAAEFGDQVLSPPSTPMVVIGTDGRVTLTPHGHKSVDEIVALAHDHGA